MLIKLNEGATPASDVLASVNPILKTVLFTPGTTTGSEDDIFDETGNVNFEQQVDTLMTKSSSIVKWGMPFILKGDPGTAKTSAIKRDSKILGLKCFTLIASLCDPTDFKGIPTISKQKLEDPNGEIKRYTGKEEIIASGFEPVYDSSLNMVMDKETGLPTLRQPNTSFRPFNGEPIHNWDGSIKRKKRTVLVSKTAIPEIYIQIAKLKRSVLFLDEFSTATPAVQAALLRPALDLIIGDFQLPGTTRILAAMNKTEQAANGSDMALPMANRFGHYNWPAPTPESWINWMLSGSNEEIASISAIAEENRVRALWEREYTLAKGIVCGYMRRRGPSALFKLPDPSDEKASAAFPTPRSWESATRAFAGAAIHNLSDLNRLDLISSFIGVDATSEFLHFVKEVDLPDPLKVLDGQEKFTHNPSRLDRTVAMLSSLTAFIVIPPSEKDEKTIALRQKRVAELARILNEIHAVTPDIIIPTVKMLVVNKILEAPVLDLVRKLTGVLDLAGYTYKAN